MKSFQSLVVAFSLIAAARAWGEGWNGTYVTTTITTDIYTTYCPYATTFTQGAHAYTATDSETITITDCPCTYVISSPKPTGTTVPHTYVSPPSNNATWNPPVWVTTTETVATLTTYCPVPTTVVQGSKTYTVTEATTLTITDCPCTHVTTVPATSTEYSSKTLSVLTTYCPSSTVITYGGQTYPIDTPGTVTIPIASISPIAATSPVAVGINTPVIPSAPSAGPLQVTGAAAHQVAGVGVLAAAGLVILF